MPGLGYRLYDTKKNRPVPEDEYYLYKVDEKGKVQKYSYQLATEGPRLVPVYKEAPHIEVEACSMFEDKYGELLHVNDRVGYQRLGNLCTGTGVIQYNKASGSFVIAIGWKEKGEYAVLIHGTVPNSICKLGTVHDCQKGDVCRD